MVANRRWTSTRGSLKAGDSKPTTEGENTHHYVGMRGSDYYFPADRHKKAEIAFRNGNPNDVTVVRGVGGTFRVPTTVPPLTPQEAENWKLDRLIYSKPLLFEVNREPKFLVPPKEKIFSLGEDMDRLDELYRLKGRYTPSEVAHVFFPIIPSFYIELRHVFHALPPSIAYRMEQDIGTRGMGANFFTGYPMLFRQRKPTHQKSAVKLNADFWFVRRHPYFKKADRFQSKHNSDYKAHIGGVVHKEAPTGDGTQNSRDIDLNIFGILARHLRRAAKDKKTDIYQPTPLIQWMNSLGKEDMAVIQMVPERRIITLLSKYVRVFQLTCAKGEDPNVYTDAANLRTDLSDTSDETLPLDMKTDEEDDMEVENREKEDMPPSAEASVEAGAAEATTASNITSSPVSSASPMNTNLDDDLLGLEDILSGQPAAPEQPAAAPPPARDQLTSDGSDLPPLMLDVLQVRCLPPSLAPRSLSNFTALNSPYVDVVKLAASFLGCPPSLRGKKNLFSFSRRNAHQITTTGMAVDPDVWRWVPISVIYDALSRDQRQRLRRFRGLTNFLRLHGQLFEVSADCMHVTSHDPAGTVSPFIPQQTTFSFEERVVLPSVEEDGRDDSATMVGEKERKSFADILGDSQIPTTRKQIALLDPHNPVLQNDVFYEEIARLLPPHPVRKREVLLKLPPILRAAVPAKGLFLNNCSRHIEVFYEGGETMVQRKELASLRTSEPEISVEAAIEAMRQSIPDGGATVKALRRMHAPSNAISTLIKHFGSVRHGLEAFPQYFAVERREGLQGSDALVRLR